MDITICTVSFRSKDYLKINWEFTKRLNLENLLKWVVVENTPQDEKDRLQSSDTRFNVLPGIDIAEIRGKYLANYHHGAALNKALQFVKSRFLLILDPDFFIVKKNWINETTAYMINNNISFLGAPWHPKWYMKPRYFPSSHCLFIDLSKVDIQGLDFIPIDCNIIKRSDGFKDRIPFLLRKRLKPFTLFIQWWIFNRKVIGAENDTGCSLLHQYNEDNKYKHECFMPVFKARRDFVGPLYMSSWFNSIVEKMLPEKLCYFPKKQKYYSCKGFKEAGYPDLSSVDWEEFLWKGQLFGFHLRGYPKRQQNPEKNNEFLNQILSYF